MKLSFDILTWVHVLPSYLFNITECTYVYTHFTSLLTTAHYISNKIDETAIVARYFAIISGVAKWHVVLFEGALLIKLLPFQCCLYLNSTALGTNQGCSINRENMV